MVKCVKIGRASLYGRTHLIIQLAEHLFAEYKILPPKKEGAQAEGLTKTNLNYPTMSL